MNKKILLITSIVIFILLNTFTVYYLNNSFFYGVVKLTSNHEINISASSPLNKKLYFTDCDCENTYKYQYEYERFYKELKIQATSKSSIIETEILLNNVKYDIDINDIINTGNIYEYNIVIKTPYPFYKKTIDLIKFVFFKFKILIFAFLSLIIFLLIRKTVKRKNISIKFNKEKLTKLFDYYNIRLMTSLVINILIVLFIFYYNSHTKKSRLDNYVHIGYSPDQYDYQTIAVNYANNYDFLILGELNKNIDYKIIETDNQSQTKQVLTGAKALNRFPAYPFLISLIYKIFGTNPIIIKSTQIFLLFLICFSLPLLAYRTWGFKGFISAIISTPFIFNYLLPYTYLILPEILSISLNFFTIFLWLETRKKFSYANFIGLSLLLGIGFLIKTSINIILPIILIDVFISLKKHKIKNIFIKSSYFILTLLLPWLPYNIYSVKKYYKLADEAIEIIQKIETKPVVEALNSLQENRKSDYLSINLKKITTEDLQYYKEKVLPEISKNHYLPFYNANIRLNENIMLLSYIKIISLNKKPYFMISLISNYGALECHNEYVTEGKITNEWLKHNDSFYNNDGLKDKSQLKRILNFYAKNPSQLFKIAHSKLKQNTEHTNIINIFTIIALIFLVLTALETNLKKQNKIITIIILSLSLLLTIFIRSSISYIFILVSFLLLFTPRLKNHNFLPFILLALNGVAYSLIAFSSQRYLSYYMFILHFLSIFLIIEIINILKSKKILSSYCKTNKVE
ncbi:MAG TPA: hypothetical protein PLW77_01435 [Bacteroidales bacterium]|nr:hypothetical protein [Bacteroidales bacterium]HQB21422.1 hypothetical protein [Bacteroidales bacterium]